MSKDTATIDTLAGIAARGGAVRDPRSIEEQLPPARPDIRLPEPQAGMGGFSPMPTFGPEELAEALIKERARMLPFLQDLCPPLSSKRKVIPLAEASWRLEPSEEWTTVALPHYGGPIGRARAWYRMDATLDSLRSGSLWICFGGVDYKAAVFFNGHLAGTHEGFFSPFSFDVTQYARAGVNEVLVRVDNDAVCMGNNSWGDPRSGDKIYGATGLGWDEPGLGWHHCPAGMGIHRPVHLETRPARHIHDLYVRPLLEEDAAEVWVEVFNCEETPCEISMELSICGQNFEGPIRLSCPELPAAEAGLSRFKIRMPMPDARLWSPEAPWLYRAQAILRCGENEDTLASQFGMRSFVLDESPGPDGQRGHFFLNGEAIRLRGANTMGHEQQCVFRGDLDQLRDDILLAKLANMNFLRFTQRPVEPEVYDLCDRLGLMAQTDLPLFAHLRRNQFCEGVRQAAEMERLIRRHPSNVLASFINEPFPAAWGDKSHRHLDRKELESFFEAAACAIRVENPDRQIKPIDGDYEPPGPGLPDNHCYAGWYNGHGLDLGKLNRGFWCAVKPGWNYACGEFGSEGLDFEDLMRTDYPADWLPKDHEDEKAWTPSRIHNAQTGGHHYLWMEPGRNMAEWIERSQEHQRWITRLMTEAFRRNNRMVSFAIHLFIDAWPAGWMKTIMDHRRRPKPAYFAYRDALAPLAANLRMDRTSYFSGERLEAEAWICNDLNRFPADMRIAYQLERGGLTLMAASAPAHIRSCAAVFQGVISFDLPEVNERGTLCLRLGLVSAGGITLHDAAVAFQVHPRMRDGGIMRGSSLGKGKAADLAKDLRLSPGRDLLIVDDPEEFDRQHQSLDEAVSQGATALLIEFPPGEYDIASSRIRFEAAGMEPRHFVARDPDHPVAQVFEPNDFRFWHDPALDRVSPLLHTLFFADRTWTPILRTGQGGWGRKWEPALAVAEKSHGKGRYIICQVSLAGRLNNPAARSFLKQLLEVRS
ncbi:MAG: sugar-binding domain-containing protein [Verrucomicrobiae bacterium]